VLTLTIAGAAAGAVETVGVNMTPPLNTDVDKPVTMTASVAEGPITVTSSVTPGTIFVDAVADEPSVVAGQSKLIFLTDSNDPGSSFVNGETGAVQLKATFGDVHDGSEIHTLTVHLQGGFTAGLAASGTLTGTYNGVAGTSFSYTYNSATGDVVITVPNDTPVNQVGGQTATVDLSFAVTAPASGTIPDNLQFTVTATANENPVTDGGCGINHTDIAADNIASITDSTGVPASHILNGNLITNTASGAQEMILTFLDQEHPLDAFAQLFVREAQGQQGAVASDAGFDIKTTDHYQIGLENPIDGHKVIVTDFDLEGITINPPSGNIQLEHEGASGKEDGITTVILPSVGGTVTGTYSVDGDQNVNTLTDSTPVTFTMLFGAEANDTLNGSSGSDLLNGGPGSDLLNGGAGNDILVFDPADTGVNAINGGTGFDILRIDQGALFNTATSQGGFAVPGIANATVDLSTAKIANMEAILLTEEYHSDSALGTQLNGLSVSNVVAFTEVTNSLSATAHSLFIIGSPGDDVELSTGATGWTHTANTFVSAGGQVFDQWIATTGGAATASLFIDNDLQVNHVPQP
jgi:hypothetical protein